MRGWVALGMFGAACALLTALGGVRVQAGMTESAGAVVFSEKGCTACHGEKLMGGEKGPDLRGVGRRLTHEQIERQVREGGGNMPAFGDVLEPAELTAVVDWLGTQKVKARKGK